MKRLTQAQRLLQYLKDAPINPLESWRSLGIYRLAARINDLRNVGHNITKTMIKVKNLYGETVKVAEYQLDKARW
jgi:hypothetical protein